MGNDADPALKQGRQSSRMERRSQCFKWRGPGELVEDMLTVDDARRVIANTWPTIVEECRAVLGGELHYQAVIYHCLRSSGVPRTQIGMNVKQYIYQPVTELFRTFQARGHEDYRDGFEPIPDVVIFDDGINADWRRRNFAVTLKHMLAAVNSRAKLSPLSR